MPDFLEEKSCSSKTHSHFEAGLGERQTKASLSTATRSTEMVGGREEGGSGYRAIPILLLLFV